ncbi:MAG: DNA translocase SpoIIIE [Cryomorphaceae bacterium]|nr:MAG: DNA translocase SpoIIIE [Cryomorphaceae bacterium]
MNGFGIATLLLPLWIMAVAARGAFGFRRIRPLYLFNHGLVIVLITSVFISWIVSGHPTVYGGLTGFYLYELLAIRLGHMGVLLLLVGSTVLYSIVAFQIRSVALPKMPTHLQPSSEVEESEQETSTDHQDEVGVPVAPSFHAATPSPSLTMIDDEESDETLNITLSTEVGLEPEEIMNTPEPSAELEPQITAVEVEAPKAVALDIPVVQPEEKTPAVEAEPELDVQVEIHEEKVEDDRSINKKVKDFGDYDPTLDLSKFQLPKIDLLKQYGDGQIKFDKAEIEQNKNNIVDTLRNYNIEIKEIKATIGPTVTLYEIVPAAGIRISKIKNLEDDIALSLAALGIRIIAPIPGKGTIGIEVPNAKPQMVSMKQVIASKKFQDSDMELPVAMGRTITNDNFVFDLAKMPHLLMAGATGQGKSVGLNAILTSLLYKKHPSQLKFVLVDPKKVELTLYNKIERHYLAVLPDSDEAIITDTAKVVNTLNSLCIEMDNRYELLKSAMVRNIKEYNAKFIARKLNPEEGHKFLPYIVLVIDEFADLIMTAGKEVEMPIARLAQLARAIGIHLIVATQRPSVNVITGIIKANFPARAAFRVTSKIDSRTILDAGGADQLIGKGDMLFSQGSDLIRLQCAFVDTPEVEDICDFIGNQQAYPMAYQLPEFVGEEGGGVGEIDAADRDALFEDAARLVVATQQGSTSMIQRKLKLGYNRAGRIVDQLEAAGILGPFEGSKARQVLVPDEFALEQKLNGDT